MDVDDLDIYHDLDDFHEEQRKKTDELVALETKLNGYLETIQGLKVEKKGLKKQIKTMQWNFQKLLDTAKAEIKRKDQQIAELRKEKDDICFRRKKPRFESQYQDHRELTSGNPFMFASENMSATTGVSVETAPHTATTPFADSMVAAVSVRPKQGNGLESSNSIRSRSGALECSQNFARTSRIDSQEVSVRSGMDADFEPLVGEIMVSGPCDALTHSNGSKTSHHSRGRSRTLERTNYHRADSNEPKRHRSRETTRKHDGSKRVRDEDVKRQHKFSGSERGRSKSVKRDRSRSRHNSKRDGKFKDENMRKESQSRSQGRHAASYGHLNKARINRSSSMDRDKRGTRKDYKTEQIHSRERQRKNSSRERTLSNKKEYNHKETDRESKFKIASLKIDAEIKKEKDKKNSAIECHKTRATSQKIPSRDTHRQLQKEPSSETLDEVAASLESSGKHTSKGDKTIFKVVNTFDLEAVSSDEEDKMSTEGRDKKVISNVSPTEIHTKSYEAKDCEGMSEKPISSVSEERLENPEVPEVCNPIAIPITLTDLETVSSDEDDTNPPSKREYKEANCKEDQAQIVAKNSEDIEGNSTIDLPEQTVEGDLPEKLKPLPKDLNTDKNSFMEANDFIAIGSDERVADSSEKYENKRITSNPSVVDITSKCSTRSNVTEQTKTLDYKKSKGSANKGKEVPKLTEAVNNPIGTVGEVLDTIVSNISAQDKSSDEISNRAAKVPTSSKISETCVANLEAVVANKELAKQDGNIDGTFCSTESSIIAPVDKNVAGLNSSSNNKGQRQVVVSVDNTNMGNKPTESSNIYICPNTFTEMEEAPIIIEDNSAANLGNIFGKYRDQTIPGLGDWDAMPTRETAKSEKITSKNSEVGFLFNESEIIAIDDDTIVEKDDENTFEQLEKGNLPQHISEPLDEGMALKLETHVEQKKSADSTNEVQLKENTASQFVERVDTTEQTMNEGNTVADTMEGKPTAVERGELAEKNCDIILKEEKITFFAQEKHCMKAKENLNLEKSSEIVEDQSQLLKQENHINILIKPIPKVFDQEDRTVKDKGAPLSEIDGKVEVAMEHLHMDMVDESIKQNKQDKKNKEKEPANTGIEKHDVAPKSCIANDKSDLKKDINKAVDVKDDYERQETFANKTESTHCADVTLDSRAVPTKSPRCLLIKDKTTNNVTERIDNQNDGREEKSADGTEHSVDVVEEDMSRSVTDTTDQFKTGLDDEISLPSRSDDLKQVAVENEKRATEELLREASETNIENGVDNSKDKDVILVAKFNTAEMKYIKENDDGEGIEEVTKNEAAIEKSNEYECETTVASHDKPSTGTGPFNILTASHDKPSTGAGPVNILTASHDKAITGAGSVSILTASHDKAITGAGSVNILTASHDKPSTGAGPVNILTASHDKAITGAGSVNILTASHDKPSTGAGPVNILTASHDKASTGAGPVNILTASHDKAITGAGSVNILTASHDKPSTGAGPVNILTASHDKASTGAGPVNILTASHDKASTGAGSVNILTASHGKPSTGAGPVNILTASHDKASTGAGPVNILTASHDKASTGAGSVKALSPIGNVLKESQDDSLKGSLKPVVKTDNETTEANDSINTAESQALQISVSPSESEGSNNNESGKICRKSFTENHLDQGLISCETREEVKGLFSPSKPLTDGNKTAQLADVDENTAIHQLPKSGRLIKPDIISLKTIDAPRENVLLSKVQAAKENATSCDLKKERLAEKIDLNMVKVGVTKVGELKPSETSITSSAGDLSVDNDSTKVCRNVEGLSRNQFENELQPKIQVAKENVTLCDNKMNLTTVEVDETKAGEHRSSETSITSSAGDFSVDNDSTKVCRNVEVFSRNQFENGSNEICETVVEIPEPNLEKSNSTASDSTDIDKDTDIVEKAKEQLRELESSTKPRRRISKEAAPKKTPPITNKSSAKSKIMKKTPPKMKNFIKLDLSSISKHRKRKAAELAGASEELTELVATEMHIEKKPEKIPSTEDLKATHGGEIKATSSKENNDRRKPPIQKEELKPKLKQHKLHMEASKHSKGETAKEKHFHTDRNRTNAEKEMKSNVKMCQESASKDKYAHPSTKKKANPEKCTKLHSPITETVKRKIDASNPKNSRLVRSLRTESVGGRVKQTSSKLTETNACHAKRTKQVEMVQHHKAKARFRQRRIFDSSSSDEDRMAAELLSTKVMETTGSPDRSAASARNVKRSRSQLEEIDNSPDLLSKKSKLCSHIDESPVLSAAAEVHPIFQMDADEASAENESSHVLAMNTSQEDAQYKEIDLRLQSMFQSPMHETVTPLESEIFPADASVCSATADAQQQNITIEETVNSSQLEQSATFDANTSLETKHLTLGSSDYRFEKISDNVVHLFITRKRGKKKPKPAAMADKDTSDSSVVLTS